MPLVGMCIALMSVRKNLCVCLCVHTHPLTLGQFVRYIDSFMHTYTGTNTRTEGVRQKEVLVPATGTTKRGAGRIRRALRPGNKDPVIFFSTLKGNFDVLDYYKRLF